MIAAAGIIQEAKLVGSQVKIVYFTNGDSNVYSVFKKEKNLRVSSDDFTKLGMQRMEEGKAATKILGLSENDLIFLGYPDQGLAPMLGKNYETPYISKATKFNFTHMKEHIKQENYIPALMLFLI